MIETTSVDTKQAKRDDHLRSPDFFDVEQHPTILVEVDEVVLTGSTGGTARGQVTIVGQTRPIERFQWRSADAWTSIGPSN